MESIFHFRLDLFLAIFKTIVNKLFPPNFCLSQFNIGT